MAQRKKTARSRLLGKAPWQVNLPWVALFAGAAFFQAELGPYISARLGQWAVFSRFDGAGVAPVRLGLMLAGAIAALAIGLIAIRGVWQALHSSKEGVSRIDER